MNETHPPHQSMMYALSGVIAGAAIASITWGVLHLWTQDREPTQSASSLARSHSTHANRAPEPCPDGMLRDRETDPVCCWLGQAYSASLERCTGTPVACPGHLVPDAESQTCAVAKEPTGACPAGKTSSAMTSGRCCWVGQWFVERDMRCVGIPHHCPEGMVVEGSDCVLDRERMTRAEIWAHMYRETRAGLELCDRHANPRRFAGALWTDFTMEPDGRPRGVGFARVSHAHVAAHPKLATCAREVLDRANIPASRFSTRIIAYPIVFSRFEAAR